MRVCLSYCAGLWRGTLNKILWPHSSHIYKEVSDSTLVSSRWAQSRRILLCLYSHILVPAPIFRHKSSASSDMCKRSNGYFDISVTPHHTTSGLRWSPINHAMCVFIILSLCCYYTSKYMVLVGIWLEVTNTLAFQLLAPEENRLSQTPSSSQVPSVKRASEPNSQQSTLCGNLTLPPSLYPRCSSLCSSLFRSFCFTSPSAMNFSLMSATSSLDSCRLFVNLACLLVVRLLVWVDWCTRCLNSQC